MDSPAATASRTVLAAPPTPGSTPGPTPDPTSGPGRQPAPGPDLGRLRDAALAEVILRRADLLPPADRALLRAHFGAGLTTHHLASLSPTLIPEPRPRARATRHDSPPPERHPRPDARLVRRRIRALADRVLSREFAFVMTHQREWPPARRRAAQALVLHGLTLRDAAARTGLPIHALRRHADEIRALCEEAHRAEMTGDSR